MHLSRFLFGTITSCFIISLYACNGNVKTEEGYVIENPSSKDEDVQSLIAEQITVAEANKMQIEKTPLAYFAVVKNYYSKTKNLPVWSSNQKFTPAATGLVEYIKNAAFQGLYSYDYNYEKIKQIKKILDGDSLKNESEKMWASADVLMTDAYVGLLKDLKQGRLVSDTFSWANDSSKYNSYFGLQLEKVKHSNNIDTLLEAVQPKIEGYVQLKKGIKHFVDSMDTRSFTYVTYPFKDSLLFVKSLKKRLGEAGIELDRTIASDSLALCTAIKTYQKKMGITADGKAGAGMIKKMNVSDKQRFNIIAITLDKYKLLPDTMPAKYIWVNLPSYHLKLVDGDSVALESKVICGKPNTPTPNITSEISDIVLYPTWTVPTSIIVKDMLPGLKRNTNYLARRGLYLLNGRGKKIDPNNINWERYTKGIPFRIQQGSGNSNALGVIKFNFDNPHSVYLHDTNQRYLYKNGVRSLSHGCVRVQEWQKLADYIVRNDSINLPKGDTLECTTDSIRMWMATRENRQINVTNKIALFIRYFSCENVNGTIRFYDDIYNEDRDLKQRYFANK
jgi:L,D-transpeptidase YcbB